MDQLHEKLNWNRLAYCYSNCIYDKKFDIVYPSLEDIQHTQTTCQEMLATLQGQTWVLDEYRQEILLAAEGLMVMAELYAKFAGYEIENFSDPNEWLEKFRTKWLEKNKESELFRIEDMFTVLNQTTV